MNEEAIDEIRRERFRKGYQGDFQSLHYAFSYTVVLRVTDITEDVR